MKISAEKLEGIKAALAKRTLAALDEREGRQARDYQLARETDSGLAADQVLAIVDDLEESREQRRVLREALEIEQEAADHFANCPKCEGEDIPCELGAEMAANAAEVRRNALAKTEATNG